jgi:thiol-disulfide isomerase/thioredoxin
MTKIYLRAFLVTALVGVLFVVVFKRWYQKTVSQEGERRLNVIERMETEGLVDFVGTDIKGRKISLEIFQGKPIIVNFWASWCAPCIEEFPSMVKLIEELKGEVALVAVSQDSSEEEMRAFLKAFPKGDNPNIYVIWDEDRSIGANYSADRLPESFVADSEHKLVRKIVGSIDWATPEAIEYMKSLVKK